MSRTATASRRPGLLAAAAIFAAFAAADAAWGQAPAANLSSHDAGFFTDLLSGRVWVLERPNSRLAADRNTVWAHYHAPDGTLLACAHLGGGYAPGTARWRAVPSRAFRALYNYLEPDAEPDPGKRRGHTPLFYDPGTGRLHNEALGQGGWAVASAGWVQESWPVSMKEACPGLPLPASLPVNRKQTARGLRRDDGAGPGRRAAQRAGVASERAWGGRDCRLRRRSDAAGRGPCEVPGRERRLRAD